MLKMKKIIVISAIALLISGCASREDILNDNDVHYFRSTKTAGALAVCIQNNANSSFANVTNASITNVVGQPIEVLVRKADSIYSVVQIKPTDTGSEAALYLGSTAIITPSYSVNFMTKNCN
jgi:hypothetical protein